MTKDKSMADTRRNLSIGQKSFEYFSLPALTEAGYGSVEQLPVTLKILLENLLRHVDQGFATENDIKTLLAWPKTRSSDHEIAFMPARVLMQDFTGVPAVVDLAAMRDAVAKKGGDPDRVNPVNPVDLVIDHSVMVDRFASDSAYAENVRIEMERNRERYEFLRWGQKAFDNFRVVPPGTGICHQVNLEFLARCVWSNESNGKCQAYPDTLVGTDSHTTMVNGLAVLGWGVGGIEAEAAMLGQPLTMRIPEVVGVCLDGHLKEGVTATDLVLTVAEMLRKHGVVGKFVEFYGAGLDDLTLADRATIANMSPEYGATATFFAVDDETLRYLELTGRDEETIALTEQYSKAQGLWRSNKPTAVYSSEVKLDLSTVEPCLAGPHRPQDRVPLPKLGEATRAQFPDDNKKSAPVSGEDWSLSDGAVVIAAITSCTNTSNPAVMMAAGLLAEKALALGLKVKPWVKTSLAPGSKVVTHYLEKAGLQDALDELGFHLVGYGCTTCIGNSGPLPPAIEEAVDKGKLTVSSVLSGNRNFEGRIHPRVRANWLASPPLVVAYALAGTTDIDLSSEPLGTSKDGKDIYLRDLWPDTQSIAKAVATVSRDMFAKDYADVFSGNEDWNAMPTAEGATYQWNDDSTYIQNPPFFSPDLLPEGGDITGCRILALLGDSVTTDHISPAGAIGTQTPAGRYLLDKGINKEDFNSYGSRRGNHEVMMRGTFANVRIRNEMLKDVEGGVTCLMPEGEQMSIYDAAMKYQEHNTPLVVLAGKEYGTGSSRDWAAKGTRLLGVHAVVAESFERIHRSNLAGMGVLPLQFPDNVNRKTLGIDGSETIDLEGLEKISTGMTVTMVVKSKDKSEQRVDLLCRLDTAEEVHYYNSGGIMPFVAEKLMS
ncbi:aconitate hydratase 1 [Pseudohongiella acticola]|uniref:Aconitate hydratase n=1 Tax=Pseudohongiella acticola TaxID=1524254 RepID=A0A1E8CIZ8_9GAMM|nr:aconitate hydratase AcnA [Pseudohongiella acticola]OFE12378.1 aconitate hydratase 1 [Pseudohongiella acticola]